MVCYRGWIIYNCVDVWPRVLAVVPQHWCCNPRETFPNFGLSRGGEAAQMGVGVHYLWNSVVISVELLVFGLCLPVDASIFMPEFRDSLAGIIWPDSVHFIWCDPPSCSMLSGPLWLRHGATLLLETVVSPLNWWLMVAVKMPRICIVMCVLPTFISVANCLLWQHLVVDRNNYEEGNSSCWNINKISK